MELGNIEAKRDWGHAEDYVKAMWLMLQNSKPEDFVIATGEQHSVKEFAKLAFAYLGLNYKKYIKIYKELKRQSEVNSLLGDYTKAKKKLGWKPKIKFKQLVQNMVEEDIKFVKKEGY